MHTDNKEVITQLQALNTLSLNPRISHWGLVAGCLLLLAGCATNGTQNQLSAEQSELYAGQPILTYLAEQQAKTPAEAMQRGRQAQITQDYDRALYEYIRAYELDDRHTEALLEIANIHYQRNNFKTAYLAYQKALFVDPNLIPAHQGSGLILLRQKQHNLALDAFTRAVALEQQHNEEHSDGSADASAQSERPRSALALESYNGLGIIYDMKGMYQEARTHYRAALAIDRHNKVILNNLGYSHYMESEWQQAEGYFSQALHADSSYQPAWKNLGLVYARQEKYSQALDALEQVMDTPQAYNDIGYICLLSKRYQDAAAFFQKAISSNPQYYAVAQQNLLRVKRLLENSPG